LTLPPAARAASKAAPAGSSLQATATVSDNGTQLRRKMEVIHPTEFTYSRQVPKDMREGQPLVTIHVVHTPYTGAFQVQPSAGMGPK